MMAQLELELSTIATICSSLESILKKCFGPNGMSIMLTTATGKLMITGNGTAILQSLQLSHPIGQVMTNSIATHCQYTGDNCKTFVFMLCRILNRLCTELHKSSSRINIMSAFAHLKQTVLPPLVCESLAEHATTVCCTQENVEQVKFACSDVFASTLRGRFNRSTARQLAMVMVEMIFKDCDVTNIPSVIEQYIKHYREICIEEVGSAVPSTHFIDAVVIQRDISGHVPSTTGHGVRFMLVGFDVMDSKTSSGCDDIPSVIHVTSTDHLQRTFECKLKQIDTLVQLLSKQGVNLLLSCSVVSDVLASHCHHAGISVVQAVDEDDMKKLAFVFNIHIIYCWSELLSSHVVGNADSCRPVQLGSHRWTLLSPTPATVTPRSRPLSRQLIVCAPTAGVCSQVASALLGCLKCARMLFDTSVLCDVSGEMWPVPCRERQPSKQASGNVITHADCAAPDRRTVTGDPHSQRGHPHCTFMSGGGTFEGDLYRALQQHKRLCNNTSLAQATSLLQHGLQSVSGHLAQNSFGPSASRPLVTAAMAMTHIQQDSVSGDVIEPLASKVTLVYDLLTLLQHLLRVDMLVSVRRLCPANDNQSDSDD